VKQVPVAIILKKELHTRQHRQRAYICGVLKVLCVQWVPRATVKGSQIRKHALIDDILNILCVSKVPQTTREARITLRSTF
jgi:hypothetical protein